MLQRTFGSSLLLEWPCDTGSQDEHYESYVINYDPPVGYPPNNSKLPSTRCTALISGTISATVYKVSVNAIRKDGSMVLVSKTNVTSSKMSDPDFVVRCQEDALFEIICSSFQKSFSGPDAPILDAIMSAQSDTVISFHASYGEDLIYHVECYPGGNIRQQSITFETMENLIVLASLKPNTEYTLKITAKYRGIQSDDAMITTFKTEGMLILRHLIQYIVKSQFLLSYFKLKQMR
ncbi:unnamed protein product [Toxocara canis]|uniref:Fibronectin type-III domain-containing protein n=1 Tax=Toxocara canis TaxID=6265 RepID=A0A183V8W6_TOXCA|nr:unnamed protein product [Toxocara canis]